MTQASIVQPSTSSPSDLPRPGVMTSAQLERTLARGRELQGLAVRGAFARVFRFLFTAAPRDRTLGRKTQAY